MESECASSAMSPEMPWNIRVPIRLVDVMQISQKNLEPRETWQMNVRQDVLLYLK